MAVCPTNTRFPHFTPEHGIFDANFLLKLMVNYSKRKVINILETLCELRYNNIIKQECIFLKLSKIKEACMKKMYFAAVAVLLAILIAGCDGFNGLPEKVASSVVGYTADGQPLVGLNVKVKSGGGRALTDTLAKAGADFYEVIFVNAAGTNIYRTSWRGDTAEGRLTVPAGIYDNAGANGKAYMAAGRRDTKTLLAVGVVEDTDGTGMTGTTDKTIVSDTTQVIFALTALTTDIATSSFGAVYGGGGISTVTATTIMVDKKNYPVFLFPQSQSDIVGTFTIGGVLFGAGDTHQNSIRVAKATPSTLIPKITSKGFIWKEGDEQLAELTTAVFAPATLLPDSAVTNTFTMNITTPAAPNGGLGLLSFEIPVYLFNDGNGSTAAHTTWYIRGGINNQLPDAGGTTNSLGGSIIYGVGDVLGGAGLLMNPHHLP